MDGEANGSARQLLQRRTNPFFVTRMVGTCEGARKLIDCAGLQLATRTVTTTTSHHAFTLADLRKLPYHFVTGCNRGRVTFLATRG